MTGCRQQTPESTAAPQTSIPQTASEQRKGLTSLQNADGFVYGATTEEGFYHVQESDEADGSLNIYYTDYSSLQTVILCSQPNCNHHSESCTGWVPYTGNGVSLMAVGEQLVLVYPGGSGTDKDGTPMFPRIQTADPDGNNRRTVVSFEANQEFFGPYLTDGKSLYARQDTYTDQGCDSALVAVNLETGEASTIFSLNSDEGDAIWGAADEFVFVRHMEIDENGAISGTQLDRVNINTQEKRSVYRSIAGCVAFNTCRCILPISYTLQHRSAQSIYEVVPHEKKNYDQPYSGFPPAAVWMQEPYAAASR